MRDQTIQLLNHALYVGGDEDILRRVMSRVLEDYRIEHDVPFETFYQTSKQRRDLGDRLVSYEE